MSNGDFKAIVWLPKGARINNVKDAAKWYLDQLSAEERVDVLSTYCRFCGDFVGDGNCYCERDFINSIG